jgi:uncharacterized membrane protein
MKLLLKIILFPILIVIGLLFLALITSVFIKKDYAVSREIVIDQPVDVVFDYIRFLENQDNYSAWADMDPDQLITYSGTDGEVGFISSWKGEKTGEGEQEITRIEENKIMETQLRFIKPFKAVNNAFMAVESLSAHQTKVTWGFSGSSPRPLNLMMVLFNIEEGVGGDYEKGLQKLKSILEQ